MRELYVRETDRQDKINVAAQFTTKDGVVVAEHNTEYKTVIAGRIQNVSINTSAAGKKYVTVSLKPDTYLDPMFEIEVTEPSATYINFFDSQYSQNATEIEKVYNEGRLPENTVVIIKATKTVHVNDMDGTERTSYIGQKVYKTYNVVETKDSNAGKGVGCWIATGSSYKKKDGTIGVCLNGYDKNAPEGNKYYRYYLTFNNELNDAQEADFEKAPNENGEMRSKRITFIIPHDKYVPKRAANGHLENAETEFSDYVIL